MRAFLWPLGSGEDGMRRLVIVEASGKIDAMRLKLRSIGYPAEVMACLGHIAANPKSLRPIGLDANLRETAYAIKSNSEHLIAKIAREAVKADQVFIATDDDTEGDVIAYDLSLALAGSADKLWRVRLRALSEPELQWAFENAERGDFKSAAHNGICRRIVDRAIGAAFSTFTATDMLTVGRVQNSLLSALATTPIQTGSYGIVARMRDGLQYRAELPIYSKSDLLDAERLAAAIHDKGAEAFVVLDQPEMEVPAATLWGFEDVVGHASLRLRIPLEQAADAFQEAYEKGKVSYPRVRKNGVTPDAIEVALALARHNRCQFNGDQIPVRAHATGIATSVGRFAHEAPRPLDEEMQLGVSLNMLSASDAVAVMVARNLIECGQTVSMKQMLLRAADRDVLFSYSAKPQRRNWKVQEPAPGYTPLPHQIALLRFMAQHNLGKPSTLVSSVTSVLRRELVHGNDCELSLSDRGRRWQEYGEQIGITARTSEQIESMLLGSISDPNAAAMAILKHQGMLEAVQLKIIQEIEVDKPMNTNELSF